MMSPKAHRVRVRVVVCVLIGTALLALACLFLWRFRESFEEDRVVAALERQGAGVQQEESQSIFERLLDVLNRRRGVSILVYDKQVDLSLARKLHGLCALHFQSTVIGEEQLQPISEMAQLNTLSIHLVLAPRRTWAHVARLKNLTLLVLEHVEVKDEGVANIATLRGLKVLCLENCGVTDKGLAHLRGLPELRELTISGSRISALGIRQLKGLSKLERLDLRDCCLTDECLEALGLCTSLGSLDVSDNPITDRGLETLSRMKNLGSIRLNRTQISDAGLQVFAPQVTEGRLLELKGTNVTEAGVAKLRSLNPLMAIELE